MRFLLLLFSFVISNFLFAQSGSTVTTIDFVKIKNNRRQEALFFYENNWKLYRDIAIKKGFIQSYRLLSTTADSIADFNLILITEYADSLQYKLSEERFQQIIKTTRPEGPKLLNELKPADFRQNVFFKQTETLFNSGRRP